MTFSSRYSGAIGSVGENSALSFAPIGHDEVISSVNAHGIPSPGSTWKRKTRRCKGWMGSAVRVILKNPLYCGRLRWNVSQFVRDPDSGKHKRRRRPKTPAAVTGTGVRARIIFASAGMPSSGSLWVGFVVIFWRRSG